MVPTNSFLYAFIALLLVLVHFTHGDDEILSQAPDQRPDLISENIIYSRHDPGHGKHRHCYHDTDPDKRYKLFGTKTTYEEARRVLMSRPETLEALKELEDLLDRQVSMPTSDNQNDEVDEGFCSINSLHDSQYQSSRFQPVMLWLFSRHAIRYPARKKIIKFSTELPKLRERILRSAEAGRSSLCDQDLEALRHWSLLPMDPTKDENSVAESGHWEVSLLGERFAQMFGHLLNLNTSDLKVYFTTKNRTRQTADSFLTGITPDSQIRQSLLGPLVNATERRRKTRSPASRFPIDLPDFHSDCEEINLGTGGKELPKPVRVQRFRRGPLVKSLVDALNERLGFTQPNDLITFKTMHLMNRMCHFDHAIRPTIGSDGRGDPAREAWCGLFTRDDHRLIEYLDDLEDFWEDSYGIDLNTKSPCVLIGDLLETIDDVLKKRDTGHHQLGRSHLYFSHAGAIKRLVSSLGLFANDLNTDDSDRKSIYYKDDPTLDDILGSLEKTSQASGGRDWRSSLIAPFNANLAFVLLKNSTSSFSSECRPSDASVTTSEEMSPTETRYKQYSVLTLLQEIPIRLPTPCPSTSILCPLGDFLNAYRPLTENCDLHDLCKH